MRVVKKAEEEHTPAAAAAAPAAVKINMCRHTPKMPGDTSIKAKRELSQGYRAESSNMLKPTYTSRVVFWCQVEACQGKLSFRHGLKILPPEASFTPVHSEHSLHLRYSAALPHVHGVADC